jgi:sigma-B regulation protein RsbU (phosphoserine phosphatase)
VVFSPQNQGTLRARTAEEAADLRFSEQTDLAAFVRDALNGKTGVREMDLDGDRVYLAGAPVETLGWAVVSLVDKAATERPAVMMQEQFDSALNEAMTSYNQGVAHSKQTILILILLILVLGSAAALTVSKRIVKPLETMTQKMRSLGGKNLQFMMEDDYRTGDEIEILAESFATLSARTLQYVDQVQRVTAEKERIGAELTMANAIQRSQLPRLFPPFPNRHEFNLFATMKPAKEVGGDFYDFFMVDNDHVALVMADVSGKGVPAALFMMVTRMLIKSRIQSGESPSEALTNVNRQLCESNELGFFVTAWLAVLEISTGKGVAVNAGHEHPVLRRSGEKYELILYRHSLALAALDGVQFKQHEFQLCPGDSIFVYTDGVTEATSSEKELFGTERMLESLNKEPDAEPDEILANVMGDINRFMDGEDQFDDITMMCLNYNGPVE